MSVRKKLILAVLDLETDPFEHGLVPVPFAAGFYDGSDYVHWWGEHAVYNLVQHLKEGEYLVYAHNGGKFDFFYLLEYLERENIKVINGRISQAKIGDSVLRDSYNILPIPLSAYEKIEIDYSKFTRDNRNKNKSEILTYLEGDCKSLYKLVSAFIKRFDRKLTLASAAMAEMETMIKAEKKKPILKFTKQQDEQFRKYYYGGRCQAFKTGYIKGPHDIVDINSAYPDAMMRQHPDPTCPGFRRLHALPKGDGCYFATIRAISKGALPCRAEDGSLSFPIDLTPRVYTVTGWEIQAGQETKTLRIVEVIEVMQPSATMNFRQYVDRFFAEKLQGKATGDKPMEIFAKLMLNSAYGKYAIDPEKFQEWVLTDIGEYPTGGIWNKEKHDIKDRDHWRFKSCFPEYGIDIYAKPAPAERGYINVSIAASITGYVRAYLWRAICASTDVLYCDTDSLVCARFAGGKIGDALGQWKLEGTAHHSYIAGKKLYALYLKKGKPRFDNDDILNKLGRREKDENWKKASKGVDLSAREIAAIAEGDAVIVWENSAPTFSLRYGARFIKRKVKRLLTPSK